MMWCNVCGVWHGYSVCDVCTQCVCKWCGVCVYAWYGVLCMVCVYICAVVCGMCVCTHVWKVSGHRPGYNRVNVGNVLVGKMAEQPLVIRVALLTCYACCMSGTVLHNTHV